MSIQELIETIDSVKDHAAHGEMDAVDAAVLIMELQASVIKQLKESI